MENLILEPLKFYEQVGREKHLQFATEHFESLVEQSKIDVEENRKTASLYRKQLEKAEKTAKKISKFKTIRGLLIALIIASIIVGLIGFMQEGVLLVLLPVASFGLAIALILIICLKINKKIKDADKVYKEQIQVANKTLQLAEAQMSTLNSLFSENDAITLIEKTVPNLKFDKNYSVTLQDNFKNNFDFDDHLDNNFSVLDTLSGRYNDNPFLFYRYKNHYLGTKSYHGTLLISWTETRRDSNGNVRTVRRTQTLHASVIKPFPYYDERTSFVYGHQTAPDLRFSRLATDIEELNDKQVEKRVKKGSKKIKQREEKNVQTGGSFTGMTNEEFDVIFGALDRDNEVQFRVMFSPLAQQNMVKLLRSKIGYGDDFSFTKSGKINHITSEHAQRWNMDCSPQKYFSYDIDIAKQNFIEFNKNYFKSVYFDFAPVLTVPAYHSEPSLTFEPLDKANNYTTFEYEVMANAIGSSNFAPSDAVTDSVLKTEYMSSSDKADCVMVTANAYSGTSRVDFVPVFGGDGRMHAVPVPWIEYLPTQKQTVMMVDGLNLSNKEFNEKTEKSGCSGQVFNAPYSYFHGLFAKIIEHDKAQETCAVLNKIKNTK